LGFYGERRYGRWRGGLKVELEEGEMGGEGRMVGF